MDIVFASFNAHKIKEVKYMLSKHTIISPASIGLKYDLEETGRSFEENALQKAQHLATLLASLPEHSTNAAILAEDSGICVHGLGGKPGIHSARFGSELGVTDDAGRVQLLLEQLKGIKNRSAHYTCAMVLLHSDEQYIIIRETWRGKIAEEAIAGETGFGYDPVFYLPELKRTVSCIPEAEKHRLSHRGKAAAIVARILKHQM